LASSKDPLVNKYTDENESWKDFVETTLADINKKNDTKLGGRDPRHVEEDDMGDQFQLPVTKKFIQHVYLYLIRT